MLKKCLMIFTNMNKKLAEMLKEVNSNIERVNDLDQKVKILGLTPRETDDEEGVFIIRELS